MKIITKTNELENIFITSSGADVHRAISVSPMSRSDTLYFFATEEAPLISQSAHLMRKKNPRINNTYVI